MYVRALSQHSAAEAEKKGEKPQYLRLEALQVSMRNIAFSILRAEDRSVPNKTKLRETRSAHFHV
jgi:hypothetical protein